MREIDLTRYIEKKSFSTDFIYSESLLKDFFEACGDYTGPFKKSIFIPHTELVIQCKKIGVELHKSRMNKQYYINTQEKEVEPILFDPSLLDVENEDNKKT
jgi:hypothetical protein